MEFDFGVTRPYPDLMRELRPVYQLVIVLDSVLILALVAAVALAPRLENLLVLAGFLAGVNAMLHSRTLAALGPALKRTLLLGGLLTILLMGVLAVVRFL